MQTQVLLRFACAGARHRDNSGCKWVCHDAAIIAVPWVMVPLRVWLAGGKTRPDLLQPSLVQDSYVCHQVLARPCWKLRSHQPRSRSLRQRPSRLPILLPSPPRCRPRPQPPPLPPPQPSPPPPPPSLLRVAVCQSTAVFVSGQASSNHCYCRAPDLVWAGAVWRKATMRHTPHTRRVTCAKR